MTAAETFTQILRTGPQARKLDFARQVAFQTYTHLLRPGADTSSASFSSSSPDFPFSFIRPNIQRPDLLQSLIKLLFSGRGGEKDVDVVTCKIEDEDTCGLGLLLLAHDVPSLVIGYWETTEELFCRQILPDNESRRQQKVRTGASPSMTQTLSGWLGPAANTNKPK